MIIAIDVGGTKISAALMNEHKIIEQRKIPSVIHNDLSNLAQHLVQLCEGWTERAQYVAIACTGQVGATHVNFLSAKQKLPLASQLKAQMHLPVHIINDAAAAAWAEYCFETKKDSSDANTFVYITVSTGIGGGIVQNGRLVTSTDGFCAHLGHVSVQYEGNNIRCHCTRTNCAEAIASGTAIAKQASIILGKSVSCETVFEQYLEHPQIACLIDHVTLAVSDLIANVKAMTGTTRIVLGGSVGSSPVFLQQVKNKVALLPTIYQVQIDSPKCGADADLIGASLFVSRLLSSQEQDI